MILVDRKLFQGSPGKGWLSVKAHSLDSEYGLCDIQQEVMYATSNKSQCILEVVSSRRLQRLVRWFRAFVGFVSIWLSI